MYKTFCYHAARNSLQNYRALCFWGLQEELGFPFLSLLFSDGGDGGKKGRKGGRGISFLSAEGSLWEEEGRKKEGGCSLSSDEERREGIDMGDRKKERRKGKDWPSR